MDIALTLLLLLPQAVSGQAQGEGFPAPLLDQAYGEDPHQLLDLYLPSEPSFPTVVFVYGGGWHSGSGKSCTAVAQSLRAHGYGCALPSHRLAPPDLWPAMIEDVASAFRWVREHVAEHGGDPARLLLAGHSSGAQLALLLASDPRFLEAEGLASTDVLGVVALSTPLDLAPRADGHGYGDMLLAGHGADVFQRDPERMRAASPLQHLRQDLPPVLLVVGERDFPMLEGDARSYVARARELGLEVPLHIAVGKDHLGVVSACITAEDPTAQRMLDFLDRRAFPTKEPR